MEPNLLYYGDNLKVLREHVADESVDLVYLDPPFNSNQDYNVLFNESDGERSEAQIRAFDDTWRWDEGAARAWEEVVTQGPERVATAMEALRRFLGENDMLAYLAMMAPRLVELRRVMKATGSIYLHCDPTASHYLKMLLDAVFGPDHFRNEVVWKRTAAHSDAQRWSPVSDTLLYYTKGLATTWNPQHAAHGEEYLESKYRFRDPDGRRYCLDNMTSPKPRPNMMYEWDGYPSPPNGWRFQRTTMERLDAEGRIWYPDSKTKRPRVKRYLDDTLGVLMGNVWTDIAPLNSQAQERLGYPTQKPESLLERILLASSNEGDLVLDPFCGCGTAVCVAERLKRRWIGIDITHLAVNLIRTRLRDAFGREARFRVVGEPEDMAGAQELARDDPFQFQCWALGLVGARPAGGIKKGADRGIDGRLRYAEGKGTTASIIFQVKAGGVGARDVRDLRGIIEREGAAIGVLLSMEPPTQPMRAEAASAGFHHPVFNSQAAYPRIQLLSVQDLFQGKQVEYPFVGGNVTLRQAPRARKAGGPRTANMFDAVRAEDPQEAAETATPYQDS